MRFAAPQAAQARFSSVCMSHLHGRPQPRRPTPRNIATASAVSTIEATNNGMAELPTASSEDSRAPRLS